MFALAANGFNKPSETFIRQHARSIAPQNTLLIAERREMARPIAADLVLASKRWPTLAPAGAGLGRVWWNALRPDRLFQSRQTRLVALLRAYRVDTIMAEYGTVAVHLIGPAQAAGCRLFVHFHGVDASKAALDPATRDNYQRLFAAAAGVFAPSRFIADRLVALGCPDAKLVVVPCGVATDAIGETTRQSGTLLAVGRFVAKKGPLNTIRAFATLARDMPQAHLTMIGEGPLLAEARALVAAEGLSGQVSLPGAMDHADVLAHLQSASLFVQHSLTPPDGDVEGLPVAILEAMAAAVPVVSTRHSGIPEAVLDGETGLLGDEGDVAAMAAHMRALLSDTDKAKALGLAGRARVQTAFSAERTARLLRDAMGLSAG